jgi:hypothetical protein
VAQTNEEKLEWVRQWRARNKDKVREYQAQNREKILEQRRARIDRDREKHRAQQRALYAVDPERRRMYNMRARHGASLDLTGTLWEAQEGKCYLCGDELAIEKAHIDHDHSCCPTGKSCPACRRGLTHRRCNSIIGYLGDDPDRLRRMADALESANAAVDQRVAERARQQPPLFP